MKHIKLFEAFESIKLSKTLGFVKGDSRKKFLGYLKTITDRLDFPMSELSDDYFEYLPFKSALNKNYVIEDKKDDCKYESEWIPGEFCESGHVKRTWGKGIRIVTCPKCQGTGFITSKVPPKLKYIKFWFDKNGEFVQVTGNNGQKVEQIGTVADVFSRDMNDYEKVGDELSVNQLKELPMGSIVRFGDAVAMVFKEDRRPGHVYMLQDLYSGSAPEYTAHSIWTKYATYSWAVSMFAGGNSDMKQPCYLLRSKNDKVTATSDDIGYCYNNIINVRNLNVSSSFNMKSTLNKAHFALILDYEKLIATEYERSSSISSKRQDRIRGAFALRKPTDIKRENIDRYIKALVDQFDAAKGLEEITKVIPRAMGRNNSIIFILTQVNISSLDEFYRLLNRVISPEINKRDKESYIRDMKSYLDDIYKRSGNINRNISTNIQKFYTDYDKLKGRFSDEENTKRIAIFEELLKMGELINKHILSDNISTVADMEICIQKIVSIKRIFERIGILNNLRYTVNALTKDSNSSAAQELVEDIHPRDFDRIMKDFEQFKIVIEKI